MKMNIYLAQAGIQEVLHAVFGLTYYRQDNDGQKGCLEETVRCLIFPRASLLNVHLGIATHISIIDISIFYGYIYSGIIYRSNT